MTVTRLSVADISKFCQTREVEIRLRAAAEPYVLTLHGEYDGYGDFFSIHLADIEFLDIAGGFSVEGAEEIGDLSAVSMFSDRWKELAGQYSPPAVVFCVAGRGDPMGRGETGEFIVIANRIDCFAGEDWTLPALT
jgi:hypothetical protein